MVDLRNVVTPVDSPPWLRTSTCIHSTVLGHVVAELWVLSLGCMFVPGFVTHDHSPEPTLVLLALDPVVMSTDL